MLSQEHPVSTQPELLDTNPSDVEGHMPASDSDHELDTFNAQTVGSVLLHAATHETDLTEDRGFEGEMKYLVETGQYLDQDAVYHHLSIALAPSEIIDKVKDDFGRLTADAMVTSVRTKLGEAFVPLLVEPSLSTRVDAFVNYAESLIAEDSTLEPWDIRNKFKESLGKTTAYRATSATPDDMKNIIANGFVSNFYRARPAETLLSNEDGYESMEYAMSDLRGRINVHAGSYANTTDSMFLSVSAYPEMAQYAASVQLRDKLAEMAAAGNKLYVFPVEIEEFKLIHYGKYLEKTIKGDGIWTDGQVQIDYEDPGVESWVEFRIPPEAIQIDKIKELDPAKIPNFRYVPAR